MTAKILSILLFLNLVAAAQLPVLTEHSYTSVLRGGSIALLGDINGDGHADYVTGPSSGSNLTLEARSGKDSSLIYSVLPPVGGAQFGPELTALDDYDGDGVVDFVSSGGFGVELLFVSGATGAPLGFVASVPGWPGFGRQCISAGDLDGDGLDEVAVTWSGSLQIQTAGMAIFDGASGVLLRTHSFPRHDIVISNLGDVDGDGLDDIGAIFETSNLPLLVARRFDIYGGANGATLVSVLVTTTNDVPTAVAGIGDIDADGYDDIALSLNQAFGIGPSRIVAYSSQTGTQLWSQWSAPLHRLGEKLSRSADVNGDGILDVIALDEQVDAYPNKKRIQVLSGDTGLPIASFEPAGSAFSLLFMDAGEDVNGDGIDDVAYANPDGNIARVGAFTTTGAQRYGVGQGSLQTLDLSWQAGPMGARHMGQLVTSGAQPNAAGFGYASWAPGMSTVAGLQVLIDTDPQNLALQVNYGFDGLGRFVAPVDLRNPFLAGNTFFIQHFELSVPLASSNGLQLRFSN